MYDLQKDRDYNKYDIGDEVIVVMKEQGGAKQYYFNRTLIRNEME